MDTAAAERISPLGQAASKGTEEETLAPPAHPSSNSPQAAPRCLSHQEAAVGQREASSRPSSFREAPLLY